MIDTLLYVLGLGIVVTFFLWLAIGPDDDQESRS